MNLLGFPAHFPKYRSPPSWLSCDRSIISMPSMQHSQPLRNLLEARAQFEGPERMVHVRIAEDDGRIYLDLADAAWRAVEIGPDGWRMVAEPPVRFRRAAGMLPLPMPAQGGSLEQLTSLLNLPGRDGLVLVTTWLLAALRPGGPYPVLTQNSEELKRLEIFAPSPYRSGMITILSNVGFIHAFRLRSRAALDLELIAVRHQVTVLRHQCPGRLRLFSTDRLLCLWLYRVWPQVLNALVVVKPADSHPVASQGLPALLAAAITPSGTIQIRDLIEQDRPALGCASHPRRTAQARPRGPTRRMMLG
jgi:hypothetical protein